MESMTRDGFIDSFIDRVRLLAEFGSTLRPCYLEPDWLAVEVNLFSSNEKKGVFVVVNSREAKKEVQFLLSHFSEILADSCCNVRDARRKEWPELKAKLKELPRSSQASAIADFMTDKDKENEFGNSVQSCALSPSQHC